MFPDVVGCCSSHPGRAATLLSSFRLLIPGVIHQEPLPCSLWSTKPSSAALGLTSIGPVTDGVQGGGAALGQERGLVGTRGHVWWCMSDMRCMRASEGLPCSAEGHGQAQSKTELVLGSPSPSGDGWEAPGTLCAADPGCSTGWAPRRVPGAGCRGR